MQAYTISIDSTQATQNTIFTVDLSGTFSLVNISKVEVLKASVSVSSNVSAVYVYIDELSDNRFNKRVAKLKDKFDSYIQTTASNPIMNQTNNNLVTGSTSQTMQIGQTFEDSHLKSAIVSWNPQSYPRTTFTPGTYWDANIVYDKPKDSISTLSVSLYDQDGKALVDLDRTYITLRFTCLLPVSSPVSVPAAIPTPQVPVTTYSRPNQFSIPRYSYYIIVAILVAIGYRLFFVSS